MLQRAWETIKVDKSSGVVYSRGDMKENAMKMKVDCPSCGGWGDQGYDEAGCRYACYFCGMSGLVDEAVAAEWKRNEAWGAYVSAEKAIRERAELGVPPGWGYYFDEYEGLVLVRPRGLKPEVMDEPEWDDIPF
jgi:hypothetical protein